MLRKTKHCYYICCVFCLFQLFSFLLGIFSVPSISILFLYAAWISHIWVKISYAMQNSYPGDSDSLSCDFFWLAVNKCLFPDGRPKKQFCLHLAWWSSELIGVVYRELGEELLRRAWLANHCYPHCDGKLTKRYVWSFLPNL